MFRFLMLIASLFLLTYSLPSIEKQLNGSEYGQTIEQIGTQINELKDNPEATAAINTIFDHVQKLLQQLNLQLDQVPKESEQQEHEKLELKAPAQQLFSIHNVELGSPRDEIEHNLGQANRVSVNEYGTNWYAYHNNYQDFFMIMYDGKNMAAGLYTNQDLISSSNGIKMGSSKADVRGKLGEPLSGIQKGLTIYQFQKDADYDVFNIDHSYVTVFYDKHENNTVTAMQLISKELEDKKNGFYTEASQELKEGFEYQMFDLTNAARVMHHLPVLTWDDHVRTTARKHSADMAENQYFDHTNLQGESPFDRMKEDNIVFHLAGENLAYGQFSSIFAHEGLMNSLGHRENILKQGYKYLGVGVAFNSESHPYYTQNYYAK
ncbi:CAP domain-containing protein [Bacillus sp. FJAT-29814]|uniref:CAP domain-containing protein n=1 Tax=Bacillus sp. FJAT-29814 TaxID=1729688 RepID=UPI000B165A97|nr:CAP domain-containing protein [Bacillus sp. FJAT-29814]